MSLWSAGWWHPIFISAASYACLHRIITRRTVVGRLFNSELGAACRRACYGRGGVGGFRVTLGKTYVAADMYFPYYVCTRMQASPCVGGRHSVWTENSLYPWYGHKKWQKKYLSPKYVLKSTTTIMLQGHHQLCWQLYCLCVGLIISDCRSSGSGTGKRVRPGPFRLRSTSY